MGVNQQGLSASADRLVQVAREVEDLGRREEALALLHQAARLHPASATIQEEIGQLHMRAGQADEALAAYERALLLDPTLWRTRHNLGVLLIRKGLLNETLAQERLLRPLCPAGADLLALSLESPPRPNSRGSAPSVTDG